MEKFLECGDLQHGFARVRCPECGHELFVAFSCHGRCFCPSCHQKRALQTAEWVSQEVCAPVSHRQFVFTIPKRLRIYFRFDRRLLGELCRAAGGPDRREARKRWAALIKQVYETDPLRCPKCGGEMKIIAFIERGQQDVIEKILKSRASGTDSGRENRLADRQMKPLPAAEDWREEGRLGGTHGSQKPAGAWRNSPVRTRVTIPVFGPCPERA